MPGSTLDVRCATEPRGSSSRPGRTPGVKGRPGVGQDHSIRRSARDDRGSRCASSPRRCPWRRATRGPARARGRWETSPSRGRSPVGRCPARRSSPASRPRGRRASARRRGRSAGARRSRRRSASHSTPASRTACSTVRPSRPKMALILASSLSPVPVSSSTRRVRPKSGSSVSDSSSTQLWRSVIRSCSSTSTAFLPDRARHQAEHRAGVELQSHPRPAASIDIAFDVRRHDGRS